MTNQRSHLRWPVLALGLLALLALMQPGPARAAPSELFFTEYIEGSSNNKALEIYNGTGAAVNLGAGGYNVQMFFNGAVTAGLTINLTGTVADGDVFVLAHSSAAAAILAQADQTNGAGWFNGNDAVVLRKGTAVVDSLGQVGFNPGTEWGTGLVSTADNTLRRKAAVCAGDAVSTDLFDPSVEWDGFATDTFGDLGVHTANCNDPVINEFVANHVSTDTNEYIEVFGPPNTSLSAFTVLQLEGDAAGSGVVDSVFAVGTTNAGGYWTTGFLNNALENGTITLLLVEGFTGAIGNDLDTNNDGAFDLTPWTRIVDGVAVSDGGSTDRTYDAAVLTAGYDGDSFLPGGASRIPNGADTDTTADWMRNDFDLAGIPSFTGTPVVGEAYNTPGAVNVPVTPGDAAPSVASTSPADGAVGVPPDVAVSVTFSEPVTIAGTVQISCGVSGVQNVTPTGGPTTFALPHAGFALGETCSVGITATQVSDQDADDPPDNMANDFSFSFTVAAPQCGLPATLISAVQGNGPASPLDGSTVSVEGVVVGDFQNVLPSPTNELNGFFLQEEDADADADPATSEGIFVFEGTGAPVMDVSVGQIVRVTGVVDEFNGLTEITPPLTIELCAALSGTATPASVSLPVNSLSDLEPFENMAVSFAQPLTVTEIFTLARFGEVLLSADGRLPNPTHVALPGAPAQAVRAANLLRSILLDDGLTNQNPDPLRHPEPGGLSAANTLRGGDTTTGLSGVMHFAFSEYRIQPTGPIAWSHDNPRPAAPPAVGGTVRVASFNLLNYFVTLGNACGPLANQECRGANSVTEFQRQRNKTLAALLALDADVVGLIELENNAAASPAADNVDPVLQDLVAGLNAATAPGTYAFIDTGVIGGDAIKVGLIYKPGRVTPAGNPAILTSAVDPDFIDTLNRPVLAQTFVDNAGGGRFTVAVNHLKSKGSDCNAVGDPDTGDLQGNCNQTRTKAAQALADWLATDPTGSGDPDFLIIGDLNSYAREDPIAALTNAGYTDLAEAFYGSNAYSYVFDGEWGYLDYALANAALAPQVTGIIEYHINADEPIALDYNVEFKSAGQIASFYAPDQYRASDHDPVLVGLNLNAPPNCSAAFPAPDLLWPANHKFAPIVIGGVTDPDGDAISVTIDSIFQDEPVDSTGDGKFAPDGRGVGTSTAEVRAERDGGGNGRVYTIGFTADDGNGNTCSGVVRVGVPKSKGHGAPVDDGPLYDSTLP